MSRAASILLGAFRPLDRRPSECLLRQHRRSAEKIRRSGWGKTTLDPPGETSFFMLQTAGSIGWVRTFVLEKGEAS